MSADTAPRSGGGNTPGEEVLAFIVIGIGAVAVIKEMTPKIINRLGVWLRRHGLLGAPGQGLFDLGSLGSVSAAQLVVAAGVLIIVGAVGGRFAGRGCRKDQ